MKFFDKSFVCVCSSAKKKQRIDRKLFGNYYHFLFKESISFCERFDLKQFFHLMIACHSNNATKERKKKTKAIVPSENDISNNFFFIPVCCVCDG